MIQNSQTLIAAAAIVWSGAFFAQQALALPGEACRSVIERALEAGGPPDEPLSQATGADVFLGFAKDHLGGQWEERAQMRLQNMPARGNKAYDRNFENRVRLYTKGVSAKEAREFLAALSRRLSAEEILDLLIHPHSSSRFQSVGAGNPLSNFFRRLHVYDRHLGKETATELLKRAFGRFLLGDPAEWPRLTLFLENYYSKEYAVSLMMADFAQHAETKLSEIEPAMKFLAHHGAKPPPYAVKPLNKTGHRSRRSANPMKRIKAISGFLRPFLKYSLPKNNPHFDEADIARVLSGLTTADSVESIKLISSIARYFEQRLRVDLGAKPAEAAQIMWSGLEHLAAGGRGLTVAQWSRRMRDDEELYYEDKLYQLKSEFTKREVIQFLLEAPEVFWNSSTDNILQQARHEIEMANRLRRTESEAKGSAAKEEELKPWQKVEIRGRVIQDMREAGYSFQDIAAAANWPLEDILRNARAAAALEELKQFQDLR